MKHDDLSCQRNDDLDDMLNNDKSDAGGMDFPDQRDRPLNIRRHQTRHRLVQQQHFRTGCQSPRDLKPLAPGRTKAPSRRLGDSSKTDILNHLAGAIHGLAGVSRSQERTNHHVLEYSHLFESLGHLKGAGKAEACTLLRGQPGHIAAI